MWCEGQFTQLTRILLTGSMPSQDAAHVIICGVLITVSIFLLLVSILFFMAVGFRATLRRDKN